MFSTPSTSTSTSTQPNQQQSSVFGPTQAPAPGANMFGGPPQQNAAQSNTGGSLFGNPGQSAQAGQPGGSVFGNPQTAPGTGAMFGSTNAGGTGAAAGGLFGHPTVAAAAGTTGGSLFGSTNNNPGAATSGGLFGNANPAPAANTGGLFGNHLTTGSNAPPAGSTLFGNTNAASTNPAATNLFANATTAGTGTGGSLFANTNTAPPAGGTGGGLFGNLNPPANTGGGIFGNTANNGSSNPAGGQFGNTNAATSSGSLFGNPSTGATNTGGGFFGNTNTAGTSNAGGGMFGNTNPSNTGGNLFGSTNATQQQPAANFFGSTQPQSAPAGSMFSGFQNNQQIPAQQQQQQQGPLFGGPSNATGSNLFGGFTLGSSALGGSTLGMSTLSGLPSINTHANHLLASRAVFSSQQQQDPQTQYAVLTQRIEAIAQAWNSSSPNCHFQHHFYNLVDPAQVHLYGRPANATNDALWQKAVQENPDPSCFVPVVASGLDDLQQRVEAQTKQAATHQENLTELKTRIKALTEKHDITTVARLSRVAALQTQLTQRVMRVVQHLHLLIPALRSSSIRAEEETLRATLEAIAEDIKRPGGIGKMRAKLNELWALVGSHDAAKERDRKDSGRGWAVVDEDGLAQIAQILANEQAGLAHVMKVLQRDLKDLNVIEGKTYKEHDPDSLLMSSIRGAAVY